MARTIHVTWHSIEQEHRLPPQTDDQTDIVKKALQTYLHKRPQFIFRTAPRHMCQKICLHSKRFISEIHHLQFGKAMALQWTPQRLTYKRDAIFYELRVHHWRAQQRTRQGAAAKRRELQLSKGKLVYMKLHLYQQKSLAKRLCEKLAPRYYGPHKVLQQIGLMAYKLELLPTSRVHPVFHVSHVSQPKKAIGSNVSMTDQPFQINPDLDWRPNLKKYQECVLLQLVRERKWSCSLNGKISRIMKQHGMTSHQST